MSLVLYIATASALIWLAHRYALRLSRGAALALLLFPLCFVGRALLTNRVYAPVDIAYATEPLNWMRAQTGMNDEYNGALSDVASQMLPYRHEVRAAFARGEWPLWDRSVMSGNILAAAAQPAAYSPFTLIACLLPVAQSFTFTAAISFFIAALSMFLFARELGCGEAAALFGAAAFAFSAGMAFFILWPLGESWALLPFVLFAVRRVVYEPSVRAMAFLTSAFTLLILAGHPESVLHVGFVGALYGVFELLRSVRADGLVRPTARNAQLGATGGRTGTSAPTRIGAALIAGVLSLGICAIYILPIADAAPQTREYEYRHTVYRATPHDTPVRTQLLRLASDFIPDVHARLGMGFDSAAVGSIALAAAIYALWRVRRAEKWFFLGLLIFSLLMHMEVPLLANAFAKLPLFDIALNTYFSFAAAFAFALLAAFGIEELGRDSALVFTFVLVAITIASLTIHLPPNIEMWGDYRVFADIFFLGIAILLVVFRTRATIPLLIILLLAQRTMQHGAIYPVYSADAAYPPIPLFEPMKNERPPFRIVGHGLTFIPGTSAFYGLEDVRGYAAMTLKSFASTWDLWSIKQPVWFNRVDDLDKPFLSFLNVRYAITWRQEHPHPNWREAARFRGAKLLENTNVIERAFVPKSVRIGFTDDESLAQMQGESDFRDHAWIRARVEQSERANGPGSVTAIRPREYGFDIDTTMNNAGWIVISEPAWRGWRAYVDDHRVGHQIANVAFLGVYVPRGAHHVRVVYWPQSFVIGRAITLATLLLLLSLCVAKTTRNLLAR